MIISDRRVIGKGSPSSDLGFYREVLRKLLSLGQQDGSVHKGATKPDGLNSIPGAHLVEREN